MLDPADIEALLLAAHGDPFAVLGPHVEPDSSLSIRCFHPGAIGVEVIERADAAVVAELLRIRDEGLFEGRVEDRELGWPYRLRVHYPLGHVVDIDDPYRFGTTIGELDRHLLGEGLHLRPYQVLGARPWQLEDVAGVRFCVWAPEASRVSVIGSFNDWDGRRHPMRLHPGLGVWELFIPGIGPGEGYKYELRSREGVVLPDKADPYGFATELRPGSANVIAAAPTARAVDPARAHVNDPDQPISIYEVHLGSWRRGPDNAFYDWARLAAELPPYVASLGFTHIELLPVCEHPFDGSWGYQVTGMYAPTRRFGEPETMHEFIAACHEHGLAVILDWVPAHFPDDPHGLAQFDGSAAYEYADPREGLHRDWDTLIYNFARNEVRNFLVGSALFWLECFELDGLRVDAVASMLYRDYSRPEGEWLPNALGGRENLEAVHFLQRLNEVIDEERPGAAVYAEDSTTWPGVTRSVDEGGLGFRYKWNMGWMHDTLAYLAEDPIFRRHHHTKLTFGIVYAFSERYVLPLSHDEVVHGKRSLINKMSGDTWQKFANLRAYFAFMWTQPGKKLLFMGGEFGQWREWNHDRALDWELLDDRNHEHHYHRGLQRTIATLNHLYRELRPLHQLDCDADGFHWITPDDDVHSVLAYLRFDRDDNAVMVVCNFTPQPRDGYRVGVSEASSWTLRFNSDASEYGGSGYAGLETATIVADEVPADGEPWSLSLMLPPLSTLVLVPDAPVTRPARRPPPDLTGPSQHPP